jgi:Flp pilus assembly pilin Flp
MRRLATSRVGAGLIEYALIVAVLALGLAGMLTIYRNSVGTLTKRTAVTVARQSGKGYGGPVIIPRRPVASAPAVEPEPSEPAEIDPDSISVAARSGR